MSGQEPAKCCGTCSLWEPNCHDSAWRSKQCWADIAIDLPASFRHPEMEAREGIDCPIWRPIEPKPILIEDQIPW